MVGTYEVGQILYLLSNKTMKVFPVQIVEEVVRNSLKGKNVHYTIMMPDKKKTLTDLDKVNAQVFDDLDDLKAFMMQNAQISIANILKNATSLVPVFGGQSAPEMQIPEAILKPQEVQDDVEEPSIESDADNVQNEKKESTIKVDIGNGIKANIKVEDLTGIARFN